MATANCPTERWEGEELHKWLAVRRYPHSHRANEGTGGRQGAIRQAILKRQGLSKGAWDYEIYIPINDGSLKHVNIELKRQKGGKVSPEQKEWGEIYEKAKIPHAVCRGVKEAVEFIRKIQAEENAKLG